MPAAVTENVFSLIWTLMREEGLSTEEARERLCNEVNSACDSIEYSENDKEDDDDSR
jgi:hypothetical protein